MNVWFTSDQHIGHALVARTRGFDSTAEHDQVLAENWDRCVKPTDTVWVCGDISAGGDLAQAYALNWFSDRPGVKRLVPGNHDGCWAGHRDAHKWENAYRQVFASLQPFARRKINGQYVLLSHFPYLGDHSPEDRYNQYRLRNHGLPLIHGHTHSSERLSWAAPASMWFGSNPPPQIHVGVDAWDFTPAPLSAIEEMLSGLEIDPELPGVLQWRWGVNDPTRL